jgi:putative FmdB family regulatory protein
MINIPVYVYSCDSCEEVKEVIKGMNDPHPEKCPDCGNDIKRIFNVAGIQFKGKGFYKTGG